jgi:hypothetical protein
MKFTEPVLEFITLAEDDIICSSCGGGTSESGAVDTEWL